MKTLLLALILASPISAHATAPPRYEIEQTSPRVLESLRTMPLLRRLHQTGMVVRCNPGDRAPSWVRFRGDTWGKDLPVTTAVRIGPDRWRISTPQYLIINTLPGLCAVSVRGSGVKSARVGVALR